MSENKKKKDSGFNFGAMIKKLSDKFKELQGEFRKIIWPDKKALVKHTINVILISGLIGGVIVVMDLVLSRGYTVFINFFY